MKAIKEEVTEKLTLNPLKCQLTYLSKSDGSAILAQGNTVTISSVNGPIHTKTHKQLVDRASLEVAFLTKSGRQMITNKYKENVIKQTCEGAILLNNFPRTGINITVQEVEDFGGLLSCCINSACLALINSGLPMKQLFAAVTCVINDLGNIILDPCVEDLKNANASMTFIFGSQQKAVINCVSEGKFNKDTYFEALQKCRVASDVIFKFYKEIVTGYCKNIF